MNNFNLISDKKIPTNGLGGYLPEESQISEKMIKKMNFLPI